MVFTVYTGILVFSRSGAKYIKGLSGLNFLGNAFSRWDAGYYAKILMDGYKDPSSTAFFPLFPFLGRAVNIFVRNPFVSLLIVSNISFLIAVIFLYKLVRDKYGEECASRAAFYISIFPTSFFFMCGLSESTFLMFSVLAFYFAEKEDWSLSGFFGILCAITRPAGTIMIIPIGLIYLEKKGFDPRKIRSDILPVLLMPLGILFFMALLIKYGRPPLDFIAANHSEWDRSYAWPLYDLGRAIVQVFTATFDQFIHGQVLVKLFLSVILVSVFLVSSVDAFFGLGAGYGTYSLLSMLLFLSTPSKTYPLYSGLRFVVVIFPVFILFAKFGKNKYVDHFIVTFSLLLLGILAVYYGMGAWLS